MKKKVIVMTLVGVILVAVVAVGASVWNAGRDEVTEPTEVVEQLTPYEETIETEEVVESISDLDTTPEEFKWKDVDATDQKYMADITSVSLYAEPREDAEVVGTVDLGTIFVFNNLTEDMEGNALDFGKLVIEESNLEGYVKISEVSVYEEHEMSEEGKKAQEEAQKQQQQTPQTQNPPQQNGLGIPDHGSSRPGGANEQSRDEINKGLRESGVGFE